MLNYCGDYKHFNDRYQIYVSTDPNSMPDLNENTNEKENRWRGTNSISSDLFNRENELGIRVWDSVYERGGEKLYVWVREYQYVDGEKQFRLVLDAVPVDRLSRLPLGGRFTVDFGSDCTWAYIWDNYTADDTKNVKYKIGRITDPAILKAIKNGETGCLDKLMTYAKNATNGYTGSCKLGESDSIISKLGLVDRAYYYGYFELDTENGKYYPIEDVMLYQAYVGSEEKNTFLYQYLDDKFVWNLSDEGTSTKEKPKDDTVSNEKLPNTGKNIIVTIVVLSLATAGLISYKKIKMLKGI